MAPDLLIEAAIRQFGERGFDGASTRAIAAEAGTVMSSITYRYGGKEGLYLACADYIALQLVTHLKPTLECIASREPLDASGAIEAVAALVETISRMMLTPESEDWAQFVIREQHRPGPAFEHLYSGVIRQMADAVVRLVRIARPSLNDSEARATGITLYGQALVLRAAHAAVLRTMRAERLSGAQQELLIQTIRANVHAILKGEPQS